MEETEKKQKSLWDSIFGTIGEVIGTFINIFGFDDPGRPGVLRFSLPARTLHWVVAVLIILLGLTGLIIFVPGWGVAGLSGWTRIIHRLCVYCLTVALVIYFVSYRKSCLEYLKESFTWTRADYGWVKAAVDYYLGGDESKMPPQGHINTGQKIWQLITILCGVTMFVTGFIMLFLKGFVAPGVFQWALFTHALAFIIGGCMLIVHFVLSAIHPTMHESLRSMIGGKISVEYAKSHYAKWYEEISKGS